MLKFNVDDKGFSTLLSFRGFGGVVRDHNGSFVDVFAKQVQHVISVYHDEYYIIAALLFVPSLPKQQI